MSMTPEEIARELYELAYQITGIKLLSFSEFEQRRYARCPDLISLFTNKAWTISLKSGQNELDPDVHRLRVPYISHFLNLELDDLPDIYTEVPILEIAQEFISDNRSLSGLIDGEAEREEARLIVDHLRSAADMIENAIDDRPRQEGA